MRQCTGAQGRKSTKIERTVAKDEATVAAYIYRRQPTRITTGGYYPIERLMKAANSAGDEKTDAEGGRRRGRQTPAVGDVARRTAEAATLQAEDAG